MKSIALPLTPNHSPLLQTFAAHAAARPFVAPPALRNTHAMTIVGSQRPRRFAILAQPHERREFRTESHTTVVAYCHWQPQRQTHPTVLVIHGLEGSAEASYVLGTASKAFAAGFNVIRFYTSFPRSVGAQCL